MSAGDGSAGSHITVQDVMEVARSVVFCNCRDFYRERQTDDPGCYRHELDAAFAPIERAVATTTTPEGNADG